MTLSSISFDCERGGQFTIIEGHVEEEGEELRLRYGINHRQMDNKP